MVDVDAEGEDDDEFQQTLEGGLDGAAFDGQGASLSTGCAGSELQKKRAAKALDGGQLGTGQGTVPRKKARKVAATYRGENELSDRGPEAAQPAATVSVLEAESSLLGEHFHGIPFAFPFAFSLLSLSISTPGYEIRSKQWEPLARFEAGVVPHFFPCENILRFSKSHAGPIALQFVANLAQFSPSGPPCRRKLSTRPKR